MELFHAYRIEGDICFLDQEESVHCIKVMRHRSGDEVFIIDGEGSLLRCRLTGDSPKGAEAVILERNEGWGCHPYKLTLAVCPTKNNERYEWFVEKATEVGVDSIVPVIGDHSERKVYKTERARKIALSATKQSLKSRIPEIIGPVSVKDFILSTPGSGAVKLIAYCFEDEAHPRTSVIEALKVSSQDEIIVLIGPEGDFSTEEAALAIENGFIPVHLGPSRLRTETAAVTAAEAVYLSRI